MTTDPHEIPPDLDELIQQYPILADGELPAPYPHADEDARGGQDDLDELGAAGDAPNTPREAVHLGREWDRQDRYLGVGYCLKTIRSLYGVAALYPDAETAWEEADRKHRTTNPAEIPFGVPVFWTNGRYGHIVLSLGKGRALTTDYVETGELGVAPISALGSWCGGRLVGYSNDLNGVDVWEARAPKPWGLEERAALVRAALKRARDNDAPERRVEGLRTWLHGIEARIDRKAGK